MIHHAQKAPELADVVWRVHLSYSTCLFWIWAYPICRDDVSEKLHLGFAELTLGCVQCDASRLCPLQDRTHQCVVLCLCGTSYKDIVHVADDSFQAFCHFRYHPVLKMFWSGGNTKW